MSHRETDHRTVRQVDGTLYQSLSEGATTHDKATVLVLNGPRDNLRCRGGIAVHQHHHLTRRESAGTMRTVLCPLGSSSVSIDNQVAFLQKLVGDIYGGLQIASAILLQVEDQVFHTLTAESFKALHKLLMGLRPEVADTDIADARTYHIRGINGLHGNLVTYDSEEQFVLNARTDDAKMHLCILRTAQPFHDLLLRHVNTRNGGVVDADDTVAGDDAHLLRGTVSDRLDHHQCVLQHLELDTDALEVAVQRLVEFLHLLGRRVTGMGVKFIEHPTDGVLHKFPFIDAIHIQIVDGHLGIL